MFTFKQPRCHLYFFCTGFHRPVQKYCYSSQSIHKWLLTSGLHTVSQYFLLLKEVYEHTATFLHLFPCPFLGNLVETLLHGNPCIFQHFCWMNIYIRLCHVLCIFLVFFKIISSAIWWLWNMSFLNILKTAQLNLYFNRMLWLYTKH